MFKTIIVVLIFNVLSLSFCSFLESGIVQTEIRTRKLRFIRTVFHLGSTYCVFFWQFRNTKITGNVTNGAPFTDTKAQCKHVHKHELHCAHPLEGTKMCRERCNEVDTNVPLLLQLCFIQHLIQQLFSAINIKHI